MCEPISAGILLGVGTAATLYGTYAQLKAQKKAAKSQQAYYDTLAIYNEEDATQIMKDAGVQETLIQDQALAETTDLKRDVRKLEGVQKTTMAAAGVGGGSVTAEDVAIDTFNQAKLDELTIRHNASMKVYEVKKSAYDQANNLRRNAYLNRTGGDNAYETGKNNQTATLLNSAGNVANTWASWASLSRAK